MLEASATMAVTLKKRGTTRGRDHAVEKPSGCLKVGKSSKNGGFDRKILWKFGVFDVSLKLH